VLGQASELATGTRVLSTKPCGNTLEREAIQCGNDQVSGLEQIVSNHLLLGRSGAIFRGVDCFELAEPTGRSVGLSNHRQTRPSID